MTVLSRLHEKGVLTRKRDKKRFLYALSQSAPARTSSLVERIHRTLFNTVRTRPIAALIEEDGLTTEELRALRALVDEKLKELVKQLSWDNIKKGYSIAEKHLRYDSLAQSKKALVAGLKEKLGEGYTPQVEKHAKAVYEDLKYQYMRDLTVKGGRIGARPHDVVRGITCEVGALPRTRGSAANRSPTSCGGAVR